MGTLLRILLLMIILVMGLPVLLVNLLGWEWLRIPLSQELSQRLGREVTIKGPISLEISRQPSIRFKDLSLANVPSAQAPALFQVEELTIRLNPTALANGQWQITQVVLTHPYLHLEYDSDGQPNWLFEGDAPTFRFSEIGQLVIQEGTIYYRDPSLDTLLAVVVNMGEEQSNQPLRWQGGGRYQGQVLQATGKAGSPLELMLPDQAPFPITAHFTLGETQGSWAGTLQNPLSLEGAHFQGMLMGTNPAQLFPITGISLPNLGHYRITAQVTHQPSRWVFEEFHGQLGSSDWAGALELDLRGPRPHLKGQLASAKLIPADFTAAAGNIPESESPEAATDGSWLLAMDMDLDLQADQLISHLPLGDVKTHLHLENGQMTLVPLRFTVADGQAVAELKVDIREPIVRSTLRGSLRQLALDALLAGLGKGVHHSGGSLSGQLELRVSGDSWDGLLGSLGGTTTLAVSGGRLDRILVGTAGLDLFKTLKVLFADDPGVDLRCALVQIKAQQGVLTLDPLIIDTVTTKFTGRGTVDLGQERLDLLVDPQSKDVSLLSARSPLEIQGSFSHPTVNPQPSSIGTRVAAAAALGVIAGPLAALLPLIETGSGKDADCAALLSRASPHSRKKVNAGSNPP